MTNPTVVPVPPAEFPEAIQAQLDETREVVRRAAALAGISAAAVDEAVDEVAAGYANARVHAFVGILVERAVRERLGLRAGWFPDASNGST